MAGKLQLTILSRGELYIVGTCGLSRLSLDEMADVLKRMKGSDAEIVPSFRGDRNGDNNFLVAFLFNPPLHVVINRKDSEKEAGLLAYNIVRPSIQDEFKKVVRAIELERTVYDSDIPKEIAGATRRIMEGYERRRRLSEARGYPLNPRFFSIMDYADFLFNYRKIKERDAIGRAFDRFGM